jgi:diguanylate cyclase (GGDEF)-like protein
VRSNTLPRLPAELVYPVLAVVLAAGAPLGFLLLRSTIAGSFPGAEWVAREVASDPVLYGYLFGSTSFVFAVVGWRVGRKVDTLRTNAATDPLTGIGNRRTFEDRLAIEVARTARHRHPLSLLLADLDGLKLLNDAHGHDAGDRALRLIATTLREACRATDFVARIGGDEFAVLAPDTSPDAALELAQRIITKLHALPPVAEQAAPLTLSIGVAGLDASNDDLGAPALLAAADKALYDAKASGRDRVSVSPSLEPGPPG